MSAEGDPTFYEADVGLPPGKDCYVERSADSEILESLRNRDYTLLLASRKVGKSSLLLRTFAKLRSEKGQTLGQAFLTAKQELSEADAGITCEEWYSSLLNALVVDAERSNSSFRISADWKDWWRNQKSILPGQRFAEFLRKFFLEPSSKPWVIAIDEIDTLLLQPFSDDFFAAIRRCRGARSSDPVFERLTFLLAGVTTPARLIKDNRRTPFNFGKNIALADFTAEQARLLLKGLAEPEEASHPALLRVLFWTGGHPYLTQVVFKTLAKLKKRGVLRTVVKWESLVDEAVNESLIQTFLTALPDSHLQDIAERRVHNLSVKSSQNYNPALKRRMLSFYRRALRGKQVVDEALSPAILELKLCGLLVLSSDNPGQLVVRNRLYQTVFSEKWVAAEMPSDVPRLWAGAMTALMLFLAIIIVMHHRQTQARIAALRYQIEEADQDVPIHAYEQLKAIKGEESLAQHLMGAYWRKKARVASLMRPRDEAAVLWLKALSEEEDTEARLQTRRALAGSFSQLVMTFRHGSAVIHAAFSPGGHRVVTASQDRTAQVWDVQSGEPIGLPLQHSNRVWNAQFSPDGHSVATASDDHTARIWDAESGQPTKVILKHLDNVWTARFSPDGKQVLTASSDGTARVWETESGKPIGLPLEHSNRVWDARFSPDGHRVVTASSDDTARIWNAENGQPNGPLLPHTSPVNDAQFSPDGNRVVTASDDYTARVWDAESGQSIGVLRHSREVHDAQFSPDGKRVATASFDHTAQIWDSESGQPIGEALQHSAEVFDAQFSPDGKRVVTASSDRTAQVWDAESSQPVGQALQHSAQVFDAQFSPDGRQLLTASFDYTARVWNAERIEPVGEILHHKDRVNDVEFSIDGHRLVTASDDNTAQVWDSDSGTRIGLPLHTHNRTICAALSADGHMVVTGCLDYMAQVWDVQSGQIVGKPLQLWGAVLHAAFSVDGRRVVTVSEYNPHGTDSAQVWDVSSSEPIGRPLSHGDVHRAEFSPDGRLLLTVNADLTATVWNVETSQLVGRPFESSSRVNDAQFSPDGKRVVTASDDYTARLWDTESGNLVGLLKHNGVVVLARFSADGQRVVTASSDRTARVWDAESGEPIGPALQHAEPVLNATFSADGQRVVTETASGLNWWILGQSNVFRAEATAWGEGAALKFPPMLVSPDGARLKLVDWWTGDSVLIRSVSVDDPEPNLPELKATPQELLTNYLMRFSLDFETNNNSEIRPSLRPRFPVAHTSSGGAGGGF